MSTVRKMLCLSLFWKLKVQMKQKYRGERCSSMTRVTAEINHQRPDFLKKKNAVSNLSSHICHSKYNQGCHINYLLQLSFVFYTKKLYGNYIFYFLPRSVLSNMKCYVGISGTASLRWVYDFITSDLAASHLGTAWADEFNMMWLWLSQLSTSMFCKKGWGPKYPSKATSLVRSCLIGYCVSFE